MVEKGNKTNKPKYFKPVARLGKKVKFSIKIILVQKQTVEKEDKLGERSRFYEVVTLQYSDD